MTRLFVGNLPENTNEDDLNSVFSSFGEVTNLDLKCKSSDDNNKKNFAFVTLSSSNYDVETCIKHFSNEEFNGNKLYVTRARESFLERLQRERQQAQNKQEEKNQQPTIPKKNPVLKLGDKLNPRKRKVDFNNHVQEFHDEHHIKKVDRVKGKDTPVGDSNINHKANVLDSKKKSDSDRKRMESMKKKRQEFKEKQLIIKTGLIGIDKVQNKKLIFSDNEEDSIPKNNSSFANKHISHKINKHNDKRELFNDDDSGDEVNFEIKEHFEGKKGQKVLDLQSRFKSDKRFVLDERFIEEDQSEEEINEKNGIKDDESVDLEQTDEKTKQMNILQDVLGVTIKTKSNEYNNNKKVKTKLGMLRFDPSQPEHAKFLAPVEEKSETIKKSKKKQKNHEKQEETTQEPTEKIPPIEVSKEQFYKVSDTLKEAIAQPTTFSLRSLFGSNEEELKKDENTEQDTGYIPLESKEKKGNKKIKNPLAPEEKNPFVYDSSDSEGEEQDANVEQAKPEIPEVKAVWKENLFFTDSDYRFAEGLAFFNKTTENDGQKERRELKSLMKKRIYNKERKNQMFQKKIGGRKKTMKKSYRKKS